MTDQTANQRIGTMCSALRGIALSLFLAPVLTGITTLPVAAQDTATQDTTDPAARERIETIIRDYLLRNPEVILEAMQALEQRQQAAKDERRRQAIGQMVPTLSASPLTPTVGPDDADVTLIEFFDYQCGYCKRLLPGLQNIMAEDDRLKVLFVELPILGPASLVASRAALAAHKQGRYLDFHVALMEFEGQLTDEAIFEQATAVGLDLDQLKADMNSADINNYLATIRSISESLDIRGTPAMIVGKTFIGGFVPEAQLKSAIEKTRAEG